MGHCVQSRFLKPCCNPTSLPSMPPPPAKRTGKPQGEQIAAQKQHLHNAYTTSTYYTPELNYTDTKPSGWMEWVKWDDPHSLHWFVIFFFF